MNKKILIAFFLGVFLASGVAYAMAITPWGYFSASGVTIGVSTSTPLPVYLPLGH